MIYYTLEIYTKWIGHDHEYFEIDRENFLGILAFLESCKYLPWEISEIKVKQYAFSEFSKVRTVLLNCFNVSFHGNNMYSTPIFTLDDVSRIV